MSTCNERIDAALQRRLADLGRLWAAGGEEVEDRLDENGYLDVNGCKWMLAEVQSRKLKQTRGNTGKYFVEKKARLERFLQGATEEDK